MIYKEDMENMYKSHIYGTGYNLLLDGIDNGEIEICSTGIWNGERYNVPLTEIVSKLISEAGMICKNSSAEIIRCIDDIRESLFSFEYNGKYVHLVLLREDGCYSQLHIAKHMAECAKDGKKTCSFELSDYNTVYGVFVEKIGMAVNISLVEINDIEQIYGIPAPFMQKEVLAVGAYL